MLWSNSAQDWEDSGGKRRVFYIQNTTGEGMQEGRKTLWGDKKGGGCVRFLRTHNGEIVKGQGALMCGKGRQPGVSFLKFVNGDSQVYEHLFSNLWTATL